MLWFFSCQNLTSQTALNSNLLRVLTHYLCKLHECNMNKFTMSSCSFKYGKIHENLRKNEIIISRSKLN